MVAAAVIALAKDSSALELARQLNEAFVEVADKVSPAGCCCHGDAEGKFSWQQAWRTAAMKMVRPGDMLPPELRRYFEEWGNRGNRGGNGNRGNRRPQRAPQMQGEAFGNRYPSEDGYILTNNHVVEGADKTFVTSGSKTERNTTPPSKAPTPNPTSP